MDHRAVKAGQLDLYEGGTYAALSATLAPAATMLVAASGVRPGEWVLDVGAGDGTVSLLVARAGGVPVASDLSAVQLHRARERAPELLTVRADVEYLPFADACFDAVLSNFGAVAAPDPDRMVAELFRVCRPGGFVGLTAWPPDSLVGEINAAVRAASGFADRFPDQELGWGVPELARARFTTHALDVQTQRLSFPWDEATRGGQGARDYAAAYAARYLANVDFADLRTTIMSRHREASGQLTADYLLVSGSAR